jgi:acetyl esterase/lipase
MAMLGWVCFNANYRLAPAATWPDPLTDTKSAIAWIRQHAHEYGADPSFIAISGGSAGGHIASMAALTGSIRDTEFGVEAPDTSIQAVIPFYGVFDLTNRLQLHNPKFLTDFIGPKLIKAKFDEELEKFAAASPRDYVSRAKQPWLVIHGTADSLAPLGEAKDFVAGLREESTAPVIFAEFPAAQHGFDIYICHRALAAVKLSARFLLTARNGGFQKPS